MEILTIEEARDILRIDGEDNDNIIKPLLAAIPDYIEQTTGAKPEDAATHRITKTVAGFLLQLWYNPDSTDSARLQIVIDSLLKTIKATTIATIKE